MLCIGFGWDGPPNATARITTHATTAMHPVRVIAREVIFIWFNSLS
jgi:hypothetical protein